MGIWLVPTLLHFYPRSQKEGPVLIPHQPPSSQTCLCSSLWFHQKLCASPLFMVIPSSPLIPVIASYPLESFFWTFLSRFYKHNLAPSFAALSIWGPCMSWRWENSALCSSLFPPLNLRSSNSVHHYHSEFQSPTKAPSFLGYFSCHFMTTHQHYLSLYSWWFQYTHRWSF